MICSVGLIPKFFNITKDLVKTSISKGLFTANFDIDSNAYCASDAEPVNANNCALSDPIERLVSKISLASPAKPTKPSVTPKALITEDKPLIL